jgi:hypothetical protein
MTAFRIHLILFYALSFLFSSISRAEDNLSLKVGAFEENIMFPKGCPSFSGCDLKNKQVIFSIRGNVATFQYAAYFFQGWSSLEDTGSGPFFGAASKPFCSYTPSYEQEAMKVIQELKQEVAKKIVLSTEPNLTGAWLQVWLNKPYEITAYFSGKRCFPPEPWIDMQISWPGGTLN